MHPGHAHPGSDRGGDGRTVEEILDDYPQLQPEDVREAQRFAAAAVDQATMPLPSG